MSEQKKIKLSQLENIAEKMWDKDNDIMYNILDKAMLDMAKETNHIIAFLVLSRAVSDNISVRQVLSRYELQEIPINTPFIKNFKDLKDRHLKFEIETQINLVLRKKKVRLSNEHFENFKIELLKELFETFKVKHVKEDETDSDKQ